MITVLKNGLIYDGTGAKPFTGDVVIDGDRIAYVGANAEVNADKLIDCTGKCIAPGFIDAHSHNDFFCDYDNAEVYFGISSRVN